MSLPQDYTISTDKSKLQLEVVHGFLSSSYWAKDIPLETVQRSIDNSLCFGLYHKDQQAGFARMISDLATFAYLADVFILEAHRGKGLSKELMREILERPQMQGLRRYCLVTNDAHKLYEQFGFYPLKSPQLWMEIKHADIYSDKE